MIPHSLPPTAAFITILDSRITLSIGDGYQSGGER